MNIQNISNLHEWLSIPGTLLHMLIILLLAWFLLRVSRKIITLFRRHMSTRVNVPADVKRIETLANVFRNVISIVISLVAGMLILSEMGISIAPILGAAGVAGLAVGFGAQSLIKDYFNGFFILLENQLGQGDQVELCGKAGVVENVTLRYISLRDDNGNVHHIPNGLITTVTNKSREFSYAVMDIGVAYRENLEAVFEIMREIGMQLREDKNFAGRISADLEIFGVEALADSAVMLRCRFKVVANEQSNVRREFLQRIKKAFDEKNIAISFPPTVRLNN
jgi:small conductance mechanosensitive channel